MATAISRKNLSDEVAQKLGIGKETSKVVIDAAAEIDAAEQELGDRMEGGWEEL